MGQMLSIEERIRSRDDISDEVKEELVNAVQKLAMDVYSDAFVTQMMAKFDSVDDREPSAKRSDIDTLDSKIDTLGATLDSGIDTLGTTLDSRIDTLGATLDGRIDTLDGRIDTLGATLDGRIDTLGTTLDGRIDTLTGEMQSMREQFSVMHTNLKWMMGIGVFFVMVEVAPWIGDVFSFGNP